MYLFIVCTKAVYTRTYGEKIEGQVEETVAKKKVKSNIAFLFSIFCSVTL